MSLVPPDFEPPRCASLDGFTLEVLAPRHAAADFLAVKSSANDIRHVFGPENDWPSADITFEQNLADLERHAEEFERRQAFAYSMLKSPAEYLGCLYIKPIKSRIAQDPERRCSMPRRSSGFPRCRTPFRRPVCRRRFKFG